MLACRCLAARLRQPLFRTWCASHPARVTSLERLPLSRPGKALNAHYRNLALFSSFRYIARRICKSEAAFATSPMCGALFTPAGVVLSPLMLGRVVAAAASTCTPPDVRTAETKE